MCPVCHGRGEVAAGVTESVVEGPPYLKGKDWRGRTVMTSRCEPRSYRVNPEALIKVSTGNVKTDYRDVYILDRNPFGDFWGIAVCGVCCGTGRFNPQVDYIPSN